jgi:hypothetical protein
MIHHDLISANINGPRTGADGAERKARKEGLKLH